MLSAFSCFTQETVDITIMDKKEGRKVVSYPADTKEFCIKYGSYTMNIEGLENLPELEAIKLEGTAFITNYSFIGKCKNLKHLVFWDDQIDDFSFLKELNNLETLTFHSCRMKSLPQISHMKKLRVFTLRSCGLKSLEEMKTLPKNLEILNLADNEFDDLKKIPKTNAKIILWCNSIGGRNYKNYVFSDDCWNLIPEEYKKYVM